MEKKKCKGCKIAAAIVSSIVAIGGIITVLYIHGKNLKEINED